MWASIRLISFCLILIGLLTTVCETLGLKNHPSLAGNSCSGVRRRCRVCSLGILIVIGFGLRTSNNEGVARPVPEGLTSDCSNGGFGHLMTRRNLKLRRASLVILCVLAFAMLSCAARAQAAVFE